MLRIGPWSLFFLVLWLAALAGCDPSGSTTVSGSVTVDGTPVAHGSIRFDSQDGEPATMGGTIQNGKFSVAVPPGAWRVRISVPRVAGKRKLYDTPDSPTRDVFEEGLPERYNTKTELTLEVKPGKNPPLEYKLTSP